MSERLGVQRLVLLNSGGFRFAEFDLKRPVHLAADNNGGKSTLVNALQFLFVDEFEKMVFGNHDPASTRRHYFGQPSSYIVFECLTRTGPQCLVVSGAGEIPGSKFSRFVHRGTFDPKHYEDAKGRLADLITLRQHLLAADILEIKHSRLWRVLCRPTDMRGDDDESSRLGILPLKREEDYRSFREVFIKLLSLSKARADELKRLLIACSCQMIHETSVDVAKQYSEQFGRLERDDTELAWVKAVCPQIDEGISLRVQISELDRQLGEAAIGARHELRRGRTLERELAHGVEAERELLLGRRAKCNANRQAINQKVGELSERRNEAVKRLGAVDRKHQKWAQTSELQINAWKARQAELGRSIHTTDARLDESEKDGLPALEREYDTKKQTVAKRMRELSDWDSRTAGYLNGLGFSAEQLEILFTLVNPDLARASYRQVLGDSDPQAVQSLLDRTLAAHADGAFSLNGVAVRVSGMPVASDLLSCSREVAQERVAFADRELAHLIALLDVARDRNGARENLQHARAALEEVDAGLHEYHEYLNEYGGRPQLVAGIAAIEKEIGEREGELKQLDNEEAELTKQVSNFESVSGDLKRWTSICTVLDKQLRDVQIGHAEEQIEQVVLEATMNALSMQTSLREGCDRLEQMRERLTSLDGQRTVARVQVRDIQQGIAIEARRKGARSAVFDQDVEREWLELGRLRNAVCASEQHLVALWNAMFKTLAGELDLLRRSVAEVKKRATRINSDLKRYRVSNLESVELYVDHDTREYTIIERMTAVDSMFLNELEVTDAKRELRQWITAGKVVDLRDLFTVRIRIQNQGELRPSDVPSIDEIGSEGTGMTAKVMIYLQLLRSIINDDQGEYQMHFYLDEIGKLDEHNVRATTEMAVRRGFIPITAEPKPCAEPLAHPEVVVYHLGKIGRYFEIIQQLTYIARAKSPAEKAPA